MRLSKSILLMLAAAFLAVPAGLFASQQACQATAPTALSKARDYPREATQLLNKIQYEAYETKEDALGMPTSSRFNQDNWQFESSQLERVKEHVDKIGKDVCRLQVIRQATLPWQQHEVDRITPVLRELAFRTQNALNQFNSHEATYWATRVPNDWAVIRAEAVKLDNTVLRQSEYAKLHTSPSGANSASSGM